MSPVSLSGWVLISRLVAAVLDSRPHAICELIYYWVNRSYYKLNERSKLFLGLGRFLN